MTDGMRKVAYIPHRYGMAGAQRGLPECHIFNISGLWEHALKMETGAEVHWPNHSSQIGELQAKAKPCLKGSG